MHVCEAAVWIALTCTQPLIKKPRGRGSASALTQRLWVGLLCTEPRDGEAARAARGRAAASRQRRAGGARGRAGHGLELGQRRAAAHPGGGQDCGFARAGRERVVRGGVRRECEEACGGSARR
eukprot:2195187-Rhodomonas_salina.1